MKSTVKRTTVCLIAAVMLCLSIKGFADKSQANELLFDGYKYLYHFNANKRGTAEIPAQSAADIEMAYRLGFKAIELNAHATATPGKYVCFHGENGKIGNELMAKDGSDISNIVISDTSYETFKNDYIYRTPNPDYQLPVISLDEALELCRQYHLIPFVSWMGYEGLEYIRQKIGDTFILILYDAYYINSSGYKGIIALYNDLYGDEFTELLEQVEKPFIYSITAVDAGKMTDEELKEKVQICHDYGCIVGGAGVYQSAIDNIRLFELGFDFLASGWEVESFAEGNLLSLHSDGLFEGYIHNGEVVDGVLKLTDGKTFGVNLTGDDSLVSKGDLKIRFTGTIKISFGEYMNEMTIASDGEKTLELTTAFFRAQPVFSIAAVGEVAIYECDYDASVC